MRILRRAAIGVLLTLLAALAVPQGSAAADSPPAARETSEYRPIYHYTPAANFMNDPNGLIKHKGVYHLFYQTNPWGIDAGNGSWGHATSRDLVSWEEKPIAISATDTEEIWSGSAVFDRTNSSGLGTTEDPPLVAIYTRRDRATGNQSQALAFSTDDGSTWTKYAGNPVLDIGYQDFRDPKVFWHEGTQRWVMVVVKSVERKVAIYSSPNLRTWTHESDFGPAGAVGSVWECPDLFPLALDGQDSEQKWVMTLSVSGKMQYFVGDFDGSSFTSPDASYTPPAGRVLANFEGETYGDWTTTGTAFGSGPAVPPSDVMGYTGARYVDSFAGDDAKTGTLTSPEFTIDRRYLNAQVGGGQYQRVEGGTTTPPTGDLIADFDADGMQPGWSGTGDFTDLANTTWSTLPGQVGRGALDTCWKNCDPATGTFRSPNFTVTRDWINLLVGGGNHPLSGSQPTAVSLVVDGQVVRTATGDNSPALNWRAWDVREFAGKSAHVLVTDERTADWGHLMVDHIVASDAAAGPWAQETTVNLVVDGKVVRSATGTNQPSLDWVSWDLADLQGRTARVQIVDTATGGWGHVFADQVMLADAPALAAAKRTRWLDHGADFYAGVTFNELEDDRRVMIAWMGSWDYPNSVPTSPWRGAQSVSRELNLRTIGGRPSVVQQPVEELQRFISGKPTKGTVAVVGEKAIPARGTALDVRLTLRPGAASDVGVVVRQGAGEGTRVGYDTRTGELYIDRRNSGNVTFSPAFPAVHRAAVPLVNGAVSVRVLVDRTSVEVFTADGSTTLTDIVFPSLTSDRVSAFAVGGTGRIEYSIRGVTSPW
jgi:fructan beta-fructosidase